jgi:hypothetical protein
MEPEAYLKGLVRKARENIDSLPEEDGARRAQEVARVRAAADALVDTGGLSPEVAYGDILDPFATEIDGLTTWRTKSVVSSIGPLIAKGSPTRQAQILRTPEPELDAEEPLSVIPLVRDLGAPVADQRLKLTAVEIWTRSILVRFIVTFPRTPRPADPDMRGIRRGPRHLYAWRVEDDRGTVYSNQGGGAQGGLDSMIIEERFAPSPTDDARTLTLVAHRVEDSDDFLLRRNREGFREEVARVTVPLANAGDS